MTSKKIFLSSLIIKQTIERKMTEKKKKRQFECMMTYEADEEDHLLQLTINKKKKKNNALCYCW